MLTGSDGWWQVEVKQLKAASGTVEQHLLQASQAAAKEAQVAPRAVTGMLLSSSLPLRAVLSEANAAGCLCSCRRATRS